MIGLMGGYRLGAMVAVIVLGAISVIAFAPGRACAWSCMPRPKDEVIASAEAIVVGTVVDRADAEADGSRYTIRVESSYRQQLPEFITVVTASAGGACGVSLQEGAREVVVLGWPGGGVSKRPGEWGANLCSNLSVTQADVDRLAGPALQPVPLPPQGHPADGRPPAGPEADSWVSTWVVAGGIAVAVSALAVIVVLVVRRPG